MLPVLKILKCVRILSVQSSFFHPSRLSSSNRLRCSGGTLWAPTSVASAWGQTAGIESSVLMRVTDHRECRVCCDERADGANERNGSEQLFRPFAAGGGWRRVRSCQTTGMTSGAVADATGRAAVLPWHQVRLCTVALDTAVAKAGMQHPRNVAGHILCWHLVTIVHTHTHTVYSSAGEHKRPSHISDPLFHLTVSIAAGWSRVCMLDIHSCQRNTSYLIAALNKWGRKWENTRHYRHSVYEDTKHINKLFGGCINFYANTASFARMMIAYWYSLRNSLNMFIYHRHPLQANFRSIHGYIFPLWTHRLSATQGHFWAKSGLWGGKKTCEHLVESVLSSQMSNELHSQGLFQSNPSASA